MRAALALAHKDLRMLLRTRALLGLLVAYPLVVAVLIGGILLNQGPPKIAFVNQDNTGDSVAIGDEEFSIESYIKRAENNGVDIIETNEKDAQRALEEGQVAGVVIVPQGTIAKLTTQLSGARLDFQTGDSALGDVVAQRMRGVIYNINLDISQALIEENSEYLNVLVEGGEVNVNGDEYDLYGLAPIAEDLRDARTQIADLENADESLVDRIDRAIEFADDAGSAIGLADNALEATAAPIRLKRERVTGKSPLLTAQALSFALAVSLAFVCIVLIAASLAAERDESVIGRLLHGLATPMQIVASKLLVGTVLALVFSAGLFAVFTALAPQAWTRLPLLLIGVIVMALACSAIGALLAVLTRDARTATLAGILLVLPLVPLLLVNDLGVIGVVQEVLPLKPGRELFNAVLFDSSPIEPLIKGVAHLLAIALIAGAFSARFLRRLSY